MDWDEQLFALFDDLEGQATALYGAEREAELADRSRSEYAAVTLASRLMASVGLPVTLDLAGATRAEGELRRVGGGWLLLSGGHAEWVVPMDAVTGVAGASERSVPEVAWSPLARLGLGSALRRLADAGEDVVLHGRDGGLWRVRLHRVGQDFVEVDQADGAGRRLVPFVAVAAVRSLR